jgi:hypothetical protein
MTKNRVIAVLVLLQISLIIVMVVISIMSKWAEIITIKTMTGTLLLNGEPSSGATK